MSEPCQSCGLIHEVTVERIVIDRGAREALGAFVDEKRWRRIAIIADVNTADVLADELGADLAAAGHTVTSAVFPQRHGLLADEEAVGRAREHFATSKPDGVIAVGAGVLNDVARYASFLDDLGYVSAPTAPSMDGYASSVAALQLDGVKITLPAHAPLGIFADTGVLSRAPREMIAWGFGDLIGKAAARFDWILGAGLSDEPFCPLIEQRVIGPLSRCVEDADALAGGDEVAITDLTSGLIESGLAMAMMGNSRPASGCEHHASHFWDLLAFRGLREHAPHGLQVGYATRFVLDIQRAALPRLGDPLLITAGSGGGADERRWFGDQFAALGPVRDEKQMWFATYGDSWPENDHKVNELRTKLTAASSGFDAVKTALDALKIPSEVGALDVDAEMLWATFLYANRLRSRFTTLDLLESQRLLEQILLDVLPEGTVPSL